MLDAAVKDALNHSYFPRFKDLFETMETSEFGTKPKYDVLKFDMWLKKLEIGEKRRLESPTPSPPEATGDKTAEEPNVEAYKNYWQQFDRKNARDLSSVSTTPDSSKDSPSSTTAATSVPASTGITPDCKRKLELKDQGLPNWIGGGAHGRSSSESSFMDNILAVYVKAMVSQEYT